MPDDPLPAPPVAEIAEASGIEYPNAIPYSHITMACVVWQDATRFARLLSWVRPFFETIAVGVQESTDDTLEVARRLADIVVEDAHRGYGDATFGPRLLPKVRTPWVLKIDADEWPSADLLDSLSCATWYAEQDHVDGLWVPFRSWVEGIEYEERHAHLRLFRTERGWPGLLHSTPPVRRARYWGHGHYRHERSLDEMMQDYLRYWDVGRGNAQWEAHNRVMMHDACAGAAVRWGWPFVQSFSWWPQVEAIAFSEEQPWQQR